MLFLCVKTRKLCLFLAWDSLLLILYYRLDLICRGENKICLPINCTFMETKSKKYRYSVSASTQIKILVLVCKKVVSVHPLCVVVVSRCVCVCEPEECTAYVCVVSRCVCEAE